VTMLDDHEENEEQKKLIIQEPPSLVPEIKNDLEAEENENGNGDDPENADKDEITQEQRAKNALIQQQYLSHFKPSHRDEQQFAAKLAVKGLQIESMGEDGNCLFRSISHQVYGKEDFHHILRIKCVDYLQSEYQYFGSYVPGGHDKQIFDGYCTRMRRNGIWGDNLEIQAFSEIYGRSIEIYAYDDKPMKTFSNQKVSDHQIEPLRLSYHCNSHYNSIINPLLHRNNILDENKVGEVEDDKIRLSYLRSAHASEATMNISDIEATDLQYFKQALIESRKMFENDNNGKIGGTQNQRFDEAIKKSLAQYEKESIDNAKQQSIKEQERRDLALALKKSQYDFTFNHLQNDDNEQLFIDQQNIFDPNGNFNNNEIQTFQNNDDLKNIENNAIKAVIDKGYSLEQATLAYSVFEPQKNQIPQQTLIQRMVEYIQNTEKATMFGYSENYYNLN